MKNYLVFVSMEGVVGLESIYRFNTYMGRKLTAENCNVLAESLFAFGAENVYIYDFRGDKIDLSLLDKRLKVVNGEEVEKLFESRRVDVGMIVGANAKNGTMNAFLDYTINAVAWHDYSINGVSTGFIGIVARYLGYHNVPLVFVSGDEAATLEAKALLPNVVTVVTKTAKTRNRASCISMEEYESRLDEALEELLSAEVLPEPLKTTFPAVLRLLSNRSDFADDTIKYNFGVARRIDALTCEKTLNRVNKFTSFIF